MRIIQFRYVYIDSIFIVCIFSGVCGLGGNQSTFTVYRLRVPVGLWPEGRRFYERSKQVLEEYADAIADVRGQTQRPVGRLTISAPVGLGELRLNTLVLEFLAQYPEIEIELNLTGRARDAEHSHRCCAPPTPWRTHFGHASTVRAARASSLHPAGAALRSPRHSVVSGMAEKRSRSGNRPAPESGWKPLIRRGSRRRGPSETARIAA
ncbi:MULTISPECIES: hypothetical protein [Paraburkholderia]|uniref:LysR substrate-binding domain-containing protein n=1 Tax=Paraburkholderia youngii TaxID=2782701 RepID=A0A7W8P1V9_9BURK|nr:hypothetical protein [Paraburkholderia youngii]MBB5401699.1 hypothetical protein [Paraburkholderia youngii]